MNGLKNIKKCEVCNSENLIPVLDLGHHPMCDDLIPVGETIECETFQIEILYCRQCDTAHQKYQVPKLRLFPKSYHYRARFTADVLSGMSSLADSIESRCGSLDKKTVLDIGCNDGSLLDVFLGKGSITIGVEPTDAFLDAQGRGHFIINDFFSESMALRILERHPHLDVITFTNVFAHIEDLPAVLKALSLLLGKDTLLVIENHYLGAVLDRNQFDTFYHEHPRTYSLNSFVHIARSLGREVVDVEFPQRYGGNIRVTIGDSGTVTAPAKARIEATLELELKFFAQFTEMRAFMTAWIREKRAEIQDLVARHGKLSAKAFPGRAAILVALLDLSVDEIDCIYEKPGSLKIGHYVPGTRITIRSDEELFVRISEIKVLLNFAWHIPSEIESYLRLHGFTGKLVHIL